MWGLTWNDKLLYRSSLARFREAVFGTCEAYGSAAAESMAAGSNEGSAEDLLTTFALTRPSGHPNDQTSRTSRGRTRDQRSSTV